MTAFLETWRKYFTLVAVFSCFINILQLTFSFYMFTIYRNIVVSYSGVSLVNITFAAFFAIFILGLFSFLRSRLLANAGYALNLSMRKQTFEIMLKSCVINPKRAYRSGIDDLGKLQSYLSAPAVYAVFDAPWTPFYLALIYLFQPVLGMVASGGAILMAGLTLLQEYMVKDSMRQANQISSENHRFVASFMDNAEVTVGMGMIGNIIDRFTLKNRLVMENQTRSSNIAGVIQAIIKPLQNVIQLLIYCFGAYYAMTEGFNVGLMVAASIIMGRGLAPIMQVTASWHYMSQTKEAYARLKRVADAEAMQKNSMSLPPPVGALTVEKVMFGLGGKLWLRGISFSLEPGELLGIIGPSGAGKTTLCRLLLGIWPSLGGKVYLDGSDIFTWSKDEIGLYMGYLPQEVTLFPGTIAQNIARLEKGDPDFLEKAVEDSGCRLLIESLPKGLNTQIGGENGIQLSGGQKQRIGLARALYGSPRFLILDEPTSNMDDSGELQLIEALNRIKEKRSCTCIMVTHKPTLLQSMDKTLVVKDGLAAAFGPTNQVLTQLAGGGGGKNQQGASNVAKAGRE